MKAAESAPGYSGGEGGSTTDTLAPANQRRFFIQRYSL